MADTIERDTRSHESRHAVKDESSFARSLKSRCSKRGFLVVSLYRKRELQQVTPKVIGYRIVA